MVALVGVGVGDVAEVFDPAHADSANTATIHKTASRCISRFRMCVVSIAEPFLYWLSGFIAVCALNSKNLPSLCDSSLDLFLGCEIGEYLSPDVSYLLLVESSKEVFPLVTDIFDRDMLLLQGVL